MGRTRPAALLLAVLLAGSACSGAPGPDDDVGTASPTVGVDDAPVTAAPADGATGNQAGQPPAVGAAATDTGPGLAALIRELPPAPTGTSALLDADRDAREDAKPAALTIPSLGVDAAPVIDVGVAPGGDLEVPPADRVGWYRYGPTPGSEGSAILAAHIAYDGQNGVFVELADIELGAELEVLDRRGVSTRFVVEAVERYAKEALPEELVFARDGDSRLVLVTCGGRFDPARRSYDDNIVVVAAPV